MSAQVQAAGYENGRVVPGLSESVKPLDSQDLAFLGATGLTATALGFTPGGLSVAAQTLMGGVLVWGAWRTAQERPIEAILAMEQNMALKKARPVPGSVEEVLR